MLKHIAFWPNRRISATRAGIGAVALSPVCLNGNMRGPAACAPNGAVPRPLPHCAEQTPLLRRPFPTVHGQPATWPIPVVPEERTDSNSEFHTVKLPPPQVAISTAGSEGIPA